jgi:hypothetical protein
MGDKKKTKHEFIRQAIKEAVERMTYASPDTWHNLPPKVELYEQLPVTIPGSNRGQLPTSPRLPTYLAAVQPK